MVSPYRVPVLETFQWQAPAISRSLSTPPIAPVPVKNDHYIVKATGSGAWALHDNDIAYYDGSTWKFTTPTAGFICWVNDENNYWFFNGAIWAAYVASTDDARRYALLVGGGL